MRYIVYAEQDTKGRWHGDLQQCWEKGGGIEGGVAQTWHSIKRKPNNMNS